MKEKMEVLVGLGLLGNAVALGICKGGLFFFIWCLLLGTALVFVFVLSVLWNLANERMLSRTLDYEFPGKLAAVVLLGMSVLAWPCMKINEEGSELYIKAPWDKWNGRRSVSERYQELVAEAESLKDAGRSDEGASK